MFRATISSPVRSTGISDMPAVEGNLGEVGGLAVSMTTPGTPRATMMPPASNFVAASASPNQALQIQSQDLANLPSATTPGVRGDGSFTDVEAKNRRQIVHFTRNQFNNKDRAYPRFRPGVPRKYNPGYPKTVKEVERMIAGQASPRKSPGEFLQGLAPDWRDAPPIDKRFCGLTTFMDEEVICVEGHAPNDVVLETTVGGENKDVPMSVVNGKTILALSDAMAKPLEKTIATTCHCMILLDKDRNAFAEKAMPRTAHELEDYLSRKGAGEIVVHHFKNLATLEDALKEHGPLVLQIRHREVWTLEFDASDISTGPEDRFHEGKTFVHYVVLDKIESGVAHVRDPAWKRSMQVTADSLLRVPDDADLSVESDNYGCYEIIEQREAPVVPAPVSNDVPPPMTYTQLAAANKQLEATVAEQAATIARLQAIIAQRLGSDFKL